MAILELWILRLCGIAVSTALQAMGEYTRHLYAGIVFFAKLSSSWQSSASQTDLALNLEIATPGKVEIRLQIDYIWSVDRWGMVWPTFMRLLG